MPSVPPGRYQSKLFNFFHRQSRRLNEQLQQRFRKLKVNLTWSAETLLYPIYKLLQRTYESAGKQLKSQQSKRELNLLNLPSSESTSQFVDIPVSNLLSAIDKIQFTTDTVSQVTNHIDYPSSSNSSRRLIQGIACDISQRQLVLISVENEILDVLNSQQQEELQKLIITEIAKYWHIWNLSPNQSKTRLLTKLGNLLARIKGNRLISAQKSQDLSTELNNFDQSLEFLDTRVATLESNALSNALIPLSQTSVIVGRKTVKLLTYILKKLDIFLYGQKQGVIIGNQEKEFSNIEVKNKKIELSALKNLILAAIDYFFGHKQSDKLRVNRELDNFLPIDRKINRKNITGKKTRLLNYNFQVTQKNNLTDEVLNDQNNDIWLTFDELFGDFTDDIDKKFQHKSLKQRKLFQSKQNSPELVTPLEIGSKINSQSTGNFINLDKSFTKEIKHQPDWIETKAKFVGYNKHPLEQLLEWLDNTMLFLEKISIKVFKFLIQLLGGKN
ncbi:MAG: hypothetical protein ACFB02_07545 [Mastigocoleus sp.]